MLLVNNEIGLINLPKNHVLYAILILLSECLSAAFAANRKCTSWEFTCKDGQCIDRYSKCDGKRDCVDGTDETHALCFTLTCPYGGFRCAYGGCINETDKCNGLQDCADNSDELMMTCPDFVWFNGTYEPCPSEHFQCRNGQCIDKYLQCDGQPDCNDKSDESITICNHPPFSCPAHSLRCAYGGCVSEMAKCNGVKECADGSDEGADLCHNGVVSNSPPPPVVTSKPIWSQGNPATIPRPRPTVVTKPSTRFPMVTKPPPRPTTTTTTERPPSFSSKSRCVVPTYPGTTFTRTSCVNDANCEEIHSNSMVNSNTVLFLKCSEGYVLPNQQVSILFCDNGKWQPQHNVACSKHCPPIMSPSLKAQCSYGGRAISCSDLMLPGTLLKSDCSVGYVEAGGQSLFFENTCKSNGEWVYPIQKCNHVCGLVNINDGLIQDGETASRSNHPWNAGIYRRLNNGTFSHICGGTLITPYSVLTAAHCAFSRRGTTQDLDNFRIGLAKFYRDYYSNKEEGIQKFEVMAIHLHPFYEKLSLNYLADIAIFELRTVAILNRFVLPACIDAKRKYTLFPTSFGEVVGWGLDRDGGDATPTLQKARLPYVGREDCIKQLKHKDIESVTIDKFCAFYSNGTKTSVRSGDSGGGLTFEFDGRNFVYGIVSTTLINQNVVTYTDLRFQPHLDFIMRTIENITLNRF